MAGMRRGIAMVVAALLAMVAVSQAQAPSEPQNVTSILEKGRQYTTIIRLMKETQQDTQLNSQLEHSSGNGYTMLAPTDKAFNNLKAGTLNSLTQQQMVALLQVHILPQYYTMESFQTASNPVRTQATSQDGSFTLNITSFANNRVDVSSVLSAVRPLAVYSIDNVLLPSELFRASASKR